MYNQKPAIFVVFMLIPILLNAQDGRLGGYHPGESYIPQLTVGSGTEWNGRQAGGMETEEFLTEKVPFFGAKTEAEYKPVNQVSADSYSIHFDSGDLIPQIEEVNAGGILDGIHNFETGSEEEKVTLFREIFEAVLMEEKENQQNKRVNTPVMTDLDGMVLDETRSKTGRDFYNSFFSSWTKPKDVKNYTIRISEKPGPGLVSVVFVEVNHENIFEVRLQPGDQRTDQAGVFAVNQTLEFLKENPSNYILY